MNIPIIRLEIENMRQTMAIALTEYTTQLDSDLHKAINAYCTPDNLYRVIENETDRILDQIIKEEVRAWFTNGEGREIIKQAVSRRLHDNLTYTPLDNYE